MLRPIQPHQNEDEDDAVELPFADACALKALADKGAARAYVRAPEIAGSVLRRLRIAGLIEIAECGRGSEVQFTPRGAGSLNAALKTIAAGPKSRGPGA